MAYIFVPLAGRRIGGLEMLCLNFGIPCIVILVTCRISEYFAYL